MNPFTDPTKKSSNPFNPKGYTSPEGQFLQSGSQYDKLLPGVDPMQNRARQQSFADEMGNAAIRLTNVIPGILEQTGYLLDAESWGSDLLGYKNDHDNFFSSLMRDWKEATNQAAPIYRENPNEIFDLTDSAWWVENGSGLVNSIAEFGLMGGGLGAGFRGAIGALGKGVASASTANRLNAAAQGLSAVALTHAEGTMTAVQVFEQIKNDQLSKGVPIEEAERIAAEGASKTWRSNFVNVALNYTSLSPMFKGAKAAAQKQAFKQLQKLPNETNAAFAKRLAAEKLDISVKNTARSAAGETVQESAEEVWNQVAQNMGLAVGDPSLGTNFEEILANTLTQEETGLAAIMGAIGGAGNTFAMQGISNMKLGKNKSNANDIRVKQFVDQQAYLVAKVGALNEIQRKYNEAVEKGDKAGVEAAKADLKALSFTDLIINDISKGKEANFKDIQSLTNGSVETYKQMLRELSMTDDSKAIEKGLEVDGENNFKKTVSEAIAEIDHLVGLHEKVQENYAYVLDPKLKGYSDQIFYLEALSYFAKKNIANANAEVSKAVNNLRENAAILGTDTKGIERLTELAIRENSIDNLGKAKVEEYNKVKSKDYNLSIQEQQKYVNKENYLKSLEETLNSLIAQRQELSNEIANVKDVYRQDFTEEQLDKKIKDSIDSNIELQIATSNRDYHRDNYTQIVSTAKFLKSKEGRDKWKNNAEAIEQNKTKAEAEFNAAKTKTEDKEKLKTKVNSVKKPVVTPTPTETTKTPVTTNEPTAEDFGVKNDEELLDNLEATEKTAEDVEDNTNDNYMRQGWQVGHTLAVPSTSFYEDNLYGQATKTSNDLPEGIEKYYDDNFLPIDTELELEFVTENELADINAQRQSAGKEPITFTRDNIENYPVKAVDSNGVIQAYYHTLDYVSNLSGDRISEDLININNSNSKTHKEVAIENTIALRNRIAKEGKVKVKVIEKTLGVFSIFKDVDKKGTPPIYRKGTEVFNNPNAEFGLYLEGKIISGDKVLLKIPEKEQVFYEDGKFYFVTPKMFGKRQARKVDTLTIGEANAQLILDAIDVFKIKDLQSPLATFASENNIDLKDIKVLTNFIKNIVYSISEKNAIALATDIVAKKYSDKQEQFVNEGKDPRNVPPVYRLAIQDAKNIAIVSSIEGTIYLVEDGKINKKDAARIKGILSQMYFSQNQKLLDPRIKDFKTIVATDTGYAVISDYKEYLKTTFETDINERQLPNGQYIYTESPLTRFTDINNTASRVDKELKKEIIPINEVIESNESQINPNANIVETLNVEEQRLSPDEIPFSLAVQSDYTSLMNGDSAPVLTHIYSIRLAAIIAEKMTSDSNLELLIEEQRKQRINVKNTSTNLEVIANTNHILDKWNEIKALAIAHLKDAQLLSVYENEQDDDDVEYRIYDKTADEEKIVLPTEFLIKTLSFVPDLGLDGKIKTVGFIPSYLDRQKVFSTLLNKLNDPATRKDYLTIKQNLQDLIPTFPWISYIISKLDNATEKERIMFMRWVDKAKVSVVNIENQTYFDDKTIKSTKSLVYNTNSQDTKSLIQGDWLSNIKDRFGRIVGDKLFFNKEGLLTIADVAANLKDREVTKEAIANYLNMLGIKLSPNALNALFTDIINENKILGSKNNTFNNKTLFKDKNGFFTILVTDLLGYTDTPFADKPSSTLRTLSEYENMYGEKPENLSFREGDKMYSTFQNKTLMSKTTSLLFDEAWQEDKKRNVFSANSVFLNDSYNKLTVQNNHTINRVTTLKLNTKGLGTAIEQANDYEMAVGKITAMFYDQSTNRLGKTFLPAFSDKKSYYVWTWDVRRPSDFKDGFNDLYISDISKAIYDEYRRVVIFSNPKISEQYKDSAYNGYRMFIINDFLNNKETFPKLYDENGDIRVLSQEEFESIIKPEVIAQLNQAVANRIEEWKKLGIIKNINKQEVIPFAADKDPLTIAMAYEYNNMLSTQNFYQLIGGDPAQQYSAKNNTPEKIMNDYSKRLAQQIAPYVSLVGDKPNNILLIDDLKIETPLGSSNSTDAQVWARLDTFLDMMYMEGKISKPIYDNLIAKYNEGKSIYSDLIKNNIILNPLKPVTSTSDTEQIGNMLFDKLDYIKSSIYPILPDFSEEHRQLDKFLRDNDINTVAPTSAYKKYSKSKKPTKLFNSDGTFNKQLKIEPSNIITLNLSDTGIQLENPLKEGNINLGSQTDKLIFANIVYETIDGEPVSELAKQYFSLREQHHRIRREQLEEELEWDGTNVNITKLKERLIEEATDRGWSPENIAALNDTIIEQGKEVFRKPLWSLNGGKNIEALLHSIVDNAVRKMKVKGTAGILGSAVLFTGNKSTEAVKYTRSKQKGMLLPERLDPTTNKVLPAQILVRWNFKDNAGNLLDINDFLDEDGYIDNTKLPQELLQSTAFRIPTQEHASMAFVEIVGFLPPTAGDLLIAPHEFTVKMGSDFDVDKLYSYFYKYVQNEDGNLVKVTKEIVNEFKSINDIDEEFINAVKREYKELSKENEQLSKELKKVKGFKFEQSLKQDILSQKIPLQDRINEFKKLLYLTDLLTDLSVIENEMLDIRNKILSSSEAFKYTNSSLDKKDLAEIAKSNRAVNKRTTNYASAAYTDSNYLNAQAAKTGVGVFATLGTFIGLSQVSNAINNSPIAFTSKLKVTIDGFKQNAISNPESYGNKLKTQVNSTFLSESVDNANNRVLEKLNVNDSTYSIVQAMIASGFNQKQIGYFILSDVMIKYSELYVQYASGSKKPIANQSLQLSAIKELIEEVKKTNPQKITKALTTDGFINDNSVEMQLSILNAAKIFEMQGEQLRGVTGTFNIDSAGLPPSFLELGTKIDKMEKYFTTDTGISNLSSMMDILPGVMYRNVMFPAQSYFKSLIPYTELEKLYEKVIKEYGEDNLETADFKLNQLKLKITNAYKSYIYTRAGNLTVTDRERLFKGNNSLVSQFKKLRNTKELQSNVFINGLFVKSSETLPSQLLFSVNNVALSNSLNIYYGFKSLFFSSNPEIVKFGESLVDYFYSMGGIQSATEFGRYIPYEYEKLGTFIDTLRYQSMRLDEQELNELFIQFLQHEDNVNNTTVDRLRDEFATDIVIEKDKLLSFKLVNGKTIYTVDGVKYLRQQDNSYIPIDDLGFSYIKEYQYGAGVGVSIVNSNKPNLKPVEKSTPQNPNPIAKEARAEESVPVTEAELLAIANRSSSPVSAIAKYFAELSKSLPPVKVNKAYKENNLGTYFNNTIYLNTNLIAKQKQSQNVVFLHEYSHHIVTEAIKNPNAKQQEIKEELNAIRRKALETISKNPKYAQFLPQAEQIAKGEFKGNANPTSKMLASLSTKYRSDYNLNEFISMFYESGELRQILSTISWNTKKTTLVDRILKLFTDLIAAFGLSENTAAYATLERIVAFNDTIANQEKVVERIELSSGTNQFQGYKGGFKDKILQKIEVDKDLAKNTILENAYNIVKILGGNLEKFKEDNKKDFIYGDPLGDYFLFKIFDYLMNQDIVTMEEANPKYFGLDSYSGFVGNLSFETPVSENLKNKNLGYLEHLSVPDRFKRKGVGKLMFNILKEKAKLDKKEGLFLWAKPESLNFWKSLGFKESGEKITNTDEQQYEKLTTGKITPYIEMYLEFKNNLIKPNYVGGKGTPQGDGKDKAMRDIADGFIGESIRSQDIKYFEILSPKTSNSSTDTSIITIANKTGNEIRIADKEVSVLVNPNYNSDNTISEFPKESGEEILRNAIIMLARNSEFKNQPLQEKTKKYILDNFNRNAEFVVGDIPGVDSQFIDYLQEIGAKFTIYHTGDNPRIKVNTTNQFTLDPEDQLSLPVLNKQEIYDSFGEKLNIPNMPSFIRRKEINLKDEMSRSMAYNQFNSLKELFGEDEVSMTIMNNYRSGTIYPSMIITLKDPSRFDNEWYIKNCL